jgi:hypothetical protein
MLLPVLDLPFSAEAVEPVVAHNVVDEVRLGLDAAILPWFVASPIDAPVPSVIPVVVGAHNKSCAGRRMLAKRKLQNENKGQKRACASRALLSNAERENVKRQIFE